MAASATSQVPDALKEGLVRFALATGELSPVERLSEQLKGESAEFLRAQVLMGTGRSAEGVEALKHVAEGQYHRAEAALLLGRYWAAQGSIPETRQWFEHAIRIGFGETRQEAGYRLAEQELRSGRSEKAGQLLAKMEAGFWASTGYLNLSSEYARSDLNPTRALVALRVAMAMAERDSDADRKDHLLNRLRVRAGYLALQNGEPDKAIGFLEKVSLESDNTPQALYLHGLALAEKGNHRASMQSWHRAKKFPLAFSGVADAWIAMGRGFDLSGYLGQAGEAYLAANAAFESERVTLRKLATGIREQGAYKSLVEDAQASDLEWFLADSRTLTQPRMAYLLDFLAQPEAQRAVRRVAELRALGQSLAQQQRDLGIFSQSLTDQLVLLDARDDGEATELRERQMTLVRDLEKLSAKSLDAGQADVLRSVSETLAASADSLQELKGRVSARPSTIRKQLDQTRTLSNQTERLSAQTLSLAQRAEKHLDQLALDYVSEQDNEMANAIDKTAQQIAHLYEYLALENLAEAAQ
ncbi:hypothetical protein [Marinobacter alexandrii]|uniref:tetratricopeptide repeat protein n=1 Tax=Marinobacter alexandrii TaxID=2570351 RepID=UPI002ABE51CE|nr:hypothetical protein [Marinobacter alexandrii]